MSFSPDVRQFLCVSLRSELQSEVELIKIVINVNPIGSHCSLQPCQLVEPHLQSAGLGL